jgi:hypothetical protein
MSYLTYKECESLSLNGIEAYNLFFKQFVSNRELGIIKSNFKIKDLVIAYKEDEHLNNIGKLKSTIHKDNLVLCTKWDVLAYNYEIDNNIYTILKNKGETNLGSLANKVCILKSTAEQLILKKI